MKCHILPIMVSQAQQQENTQCQHGGLGSALSQATWRGCKLALPPSGQSGNNSKIPSEHPANLLSTDSKETIRDTATELSDIALLTLVKDKTSFTSTVVKVQCIVDVIMQSLKWKEYLRNVT